MKEQQSKFHKAVSLGGALIAALSLVFMASVVASGQTISLPSSPDENTNSSLHGITFPVVELGGCANKNECKTYCNEPANMDACIAFAKDHGIMTATDATRAGKFGKLVRAGNGPGQCDSPESCGTYCSVISHLDECTTFAEKNGFKDEHYEQGKKIQSFLKKGGTTPGGCQSKQECDAYCGNFSHAKECFDFAQKAGIVQTEGVRGAGNTSPSDERMAKFAELAQSGETPGGCTSKDECEKYCSDQSHREECVNFGVKVGFIKPDEAARVKEMGGKGPGGCDSEVACRAYCNDQSHHEECFKFAEDHGFISSEESAKAQEGLVRAHMGFENAPQKVQECLKTTLDAGTLADIQSGKLVPGPDIANQVRGCFEKFGGTVRPQEALKNLSSETTACLKEKFGDTFDKIRTGKASTTPEMADMFRECFHGIPADNMGRPPFTGGDDGTTTQGRRNPFDNQENQGNMGQHPVEQTMQDMLRSAPPEVIACLKEKFPDGFPPVGGAAGQLGAEIKDKVRGCFENFRPAMNQIQGMVPQKDREGSQRESPNGSINQTATSGFEGQPPKPPAGGGLVNMPPAVLTCIRETIGEDRFQQIQTAPASLEIIGVIRTCLEKMPNPPVPQMPPLSPIQPASTSAPMTFLEKLIGAALMPARWILGK